MSSALTGEPVTDLNYVVAGRGANDGGHFGAACTACVSRDLPFLAIIFPEAGGGVERTAANLGLVYAVDFPFMVRDDAPIEPEGNDSILSSGFSLPEDSVRRALPASLIAETRKQGARRFFLGATPAGYRLYESLGFTTRVVAKVWASGETHQG